MSRWIQVTLPAKGRGTVASREHEATVAFKAAKQQRARKRRKRQLPLAA